MPATPHRAAAVLSAEADLRVSLSELLHSPPSRASLAARPVPAACAALINEANLLRPSPDTHFRDLSRLARAVEPCIDYLSLCLPPVSDTHHDKCRANAAAHCAPVAAAFALLRSSAFEHKLAQALFGLVSHALRADAPQYWADALTDVAPAVVPALHVLVEAGERDVLIEASRSVPAMVEMVEIFAPQMTGPNRSSVHALLEIMVSVVAFATCTPGAPPVNKDTLDGLRQVRNKVGTLAGEDAPICADLDTLLARLCGKPP